MAIKSREIALRCAASLPPHLLFRGWTRHRLTDQNTLSDLGFEGQRMSKELAEQLTKCKDDMAQRLILGRSK